MPAPKISKQIRIKVYNFNNQLLSGATVTLTLNETLTEISNSKGEVIFNVANLSSWSVNDKVTLVASKTKEGTITQTLILTSTTQIVSLTLAQTSELYYVENDDSHVLNFSLLVDFEGNKITHSNPLPVSAETKLNEPAQVNVYDSSNRLSTETITVNGVQYLRTFTYTGNNFQFTSRSAWQRI